MIEENHRSAQNAASDVMAPSAMRRETRLIRAGDRTRTGDVQLGKLAFYQLNYDREKQSDRSRWRGIWLPDRRALTHALCHITSNSNQMHPGVRVDPHKPMSSRRR